MGQEPISALDFASWPLRLTAYVMDYIPQLAGGALSFFGFFLFIISFIEDDAVPDDGSALVDSGEVDMALFVIGAFLLAVGVGILIGYLVWWLLTLRRGQTPGKQIVGICAVNAAGESLGWGPMFVREFLVKGLLFGLLYTLTLGILFIVDHLWPLWDDDNQTLHDKVVGSYVVHVPRG